MGENRTAQIASITRRIPFPPQKLQFASSLFLLFFISSHLLSFHPSSSLFPTFYLFSFSCLFVFLPHHYNMDMNHLIGSVFSAGLNHGLCG